MSCPFLREENVKYCVASAFRKMIPESARDAGHERCSSAAYRDCPAAAAKVGGSPIADRCPFLDDADVEFCAAAPVATYVPVNDSLPSRCTSAGHLYCDLFLATADPGRVHRTGSVVLPGSSGSGRRTVVVGGIPVPAYLSYAPNHMWLDRAGDGRCHVGIDAFLAEVVGRVDAISFVRPGRGAAQPIAVLTVNGVEMHLVFPHEMEDVTANTCLRADPSRLTADPYGAGWLFAGVDPTTTGAPPGAAASAGLIAGENAARWFVAEGGRLRAFVQQRIEPPADGARVMAGGGRVAPGLAARLERDLLIALFNEFFSPHPGSRRPS
ncbi:MAG: hypothetical protein PHQ91_01075 [Thermoanaerobaculaceae bacterium]|nr:hypothetical protein [Thermoanaerobaculaceae bacterium]